MSANVSVDIETGGLNKRAAIFSIGAARFDIGTGYVSSTFYRTVRLASCLAFGMETNAETMRWLNEQTESVRAALHCPDAVSIETALKEFAAFVGDSCTGLWGNGPAFDNAILGEAYRLTGIRQPVHFRFDRCVRTIIALARSCGTDPKVLVAPNEAAHNALSDALYQAALVSKSYQIITQRN